MARPEVRLTVVGGAFALGLAALVARAAQVQLVEGARYAQMAASQRTESVELPARRGTLYDRTGAPLATTLESFHVGLTPRNLRDPAAATRLLARQLGVSAREVRRELRKKYAYFHGPFTSAQVYPLRSLPGLDLEAVPVRSYPNPSFAQPILGRPAADGRPASGIESTLDSLLAGVPGRAVVLRDGRGRPLESPSRLGAFPQPGDDVYLTLDAGLQEIVETALADAIERLDADGGDVVVVDPHTGEILAVTSRTARGAATTAAFTSAFEPGSTAKLFAAAGLLEHDLVAPTDSVFGEGRQWVLPHRTIRDEPEVHLAWMTLADAIRVSSNIATVKFASRMDPATQYTMLRAFGVGSETGVEFPAESRGRLKRPDEWSGTTAQALAMGYELSVTSLQLALAYAAIANDGVLLEPTLIREVRAPDGHVVYTHRPEPVRRVVRPEVAARLRDMLRGVVGGGTAASAAMSTYELAGKTGTAKVAGPRGYIPGEHTAVFVALFPADDPQLVTVVKLDSPRGSYAAQTAAPLTRRVLEQLLAAQTGALDRSRLSQDVARELPGRSEPLAEVAPLVFDWPNPVLPTNPGARRVPNVVGLAPREAVARLHRLGLHVRWEGFGAVVRTRPAAGDSVRAGGVVTVYAEGQGP
jgi:cell division protein FtsI (penicillin-binding protein 3)